MISLGNLRASAAPWLLLPVLLYMVAVIVGNANAAAPGFGVSSGDQAAWGVVVIAPATAAAAAWEAGRHRRLGQLGQVGARGAARRFLRAAVPVLVLQVLLVAGALVAARSVLGAWPSGRGLLPVAHLLVLPWGWGVVGWALGLVCPRAVAAPVAALGSWAFMAMPQSMTAPAWRHLGGFVSEDSTRSALVDPVAYLVPWAVVAGLALGALLLTGVPRRPWLLVVSLVVVVTTLVMGRALVSGWGYEPPFDSRSVVAPFACVPGRCPTTEDGGGHHGRRGRAPSRAGPLSRADTAPVPSAGARPQAYRAALRERGRGPA